VRQRIAGPPLSGRVTLEPWAASDQVPELLRRLHALVLPSRTTATWKEQFGRIIPEAMACGVPVIGSSSGEIPHVIGEAGLVFSEGDAAELAECLRRLAADDALRERLRRRGRERVLANYTQRSLAAAYAAIYRELGAGS
jgi:glycosyltransferase involved in cell wall biosynthesis